MACAGLLIGTLILDGYEINFLYWTKYLPHIAKTGLLPPDVFDAKLTPHAEVITYQGKTYVAAQDYGGYKLGIESCGNLVVPVSADWDNYEE